MPLLTAGLFPSKQCYAFMTGMKLKEKCIHWHACTTTSTAAGGKLRQNTGSPGQRADDLEAGMSGGGGGAYREGYTYAYS